MPYGQQQHTTPTKINGRDPKIPAIDHSVTATSEAGEQYPDLHERRKQDDTRHADEGGVRRNYRFTVTPEHLIDDPAVSDRAMRLWCVLDRIAGERGRAWPSRETLARRLRVSKRTIDGAIGDLVTAGWLTVTYTHHETNIYTLRVVPSTVVEDRVRATLDAAEEAGNDDFEDRPPLAQSPLATGCDGVPGVAAGAHHPSQSTATTPRSRLRTEGDTPREGTRDNPNPNAIINSAPSGRYVDDRAAVAATSHDDDHADTPPTMIDKPDMGKIDTPVNGHTPPAIDKPDPVKIKPRTNEHHKIDTTDDGLFVAAPPTQPKPKAKARTNRGQPDPIMSQGEALARRWRSHCDTNSIPTISLRPSSNPHIVLRNLIVGALRAGVTEAEVWSALLDAGVAVPSLTALQRGIGQARNPSQQRDRWRPSNAAVYTADQREQAAAELAAAFG